MSFQDILVFILHSLGTLYIGAIWLRVVMQMLRVDFYNPLSQAVVKVTNPLVLPLRRFVPSVGPLDTATVLLAYLFTVVLGLLTALIYSAQISPVDQLIWGTVASVALLVKMTRWIVLIGVILSWFPAAQSHPAGSIVIQICSGVLRPLRGIIPNAGGLDLSPIFGLIGLVVIEMLLGIAAQSLGVPDGLYGWQLAYR